MQSLKILSSKVTMFSLLFILIIRLDILIAPEIPGGTHVQATSTLPLVLIRTEDGQLISPTKITEPVIDKIGNFLFGTKFSAEEEGKQLFFCGRTQTKKNTRTSTKEDTSDPDNQYTLHELSEPTPPSESAPQSKAGSVAVKKNYLQCSQEPEPFVLKLSKKDSANKETEVYCGSLYHRKSKMFAFVYKVETNDDNKTHVIEMYRFCYDDIKQKVIYAVHTITSPKLLENAFLAPEQLKTYKTSDKGFGYFGTRFETVKKAYEDFLKNRKEGKQMKTDWLENSKIKITPKSELSAKHLVPVDDMAFGLWRKSTYHALNAKLMADDKSKLWDDISLAIRKDAILNSREYLIYTGAFDITSEGKEENESIQSPDFWIKLVQYNKKNDNELDEAIAVVMVHNPKIEMVDNVFKDICKENVCGKAFAQKHPSASTSVCCTTKMAKVDFYFDLNLNNHLPLKIHNLYTIEKPENLYTTAKPEDLYSIEEKMSKERLIVPKIHEEAKMYSQSREMLASA